MKTGNLQKSISLAIDAHPSLCEGHILIAIVNDEVVLSGTVDAFPKKMLAEEIAAKYVDSNKVINRIHVHFPEKITDDLILSEIVNKFKTNFGNSYSNIDISIHKGFVQLKGQLKWKYQHQLATDCIKDLPGIKGILNETTVPPQENQISVDEVLTALKSQVSADINNIQFEISQHKVVLNGMIESETQKQLITKIVRRIPGVLEIENHLYINDMPRYRNE